MTVVSPSQNITHHRHMLARIIAKPISKVRFIMSPVGGGFGGKEDMIYQGMLALLAMKTERPVRLVFTREESIISTAKRHPSRTTLRMGLTRDGRIRALAMRMVCDGGAYGLSTEGVMRKAAILGAGPYVIPNVQIDTIGIYTNNTPSGAFRSFGALQTAVRHRDAISTSRPSGSASIRSRSGASTPCRTAPRRTPSRSSARSA